MRVGEALKCRQKAVIVLRPLAIAHKDHSTRGSVQDQDQVAVAATNAYLITRKPPQGTKWGPKRLCR